MSIEKQISYIASEVAEIKNIVDTMNQNTIWLIKDLEGEIGELQKILSNKEDREDKPFLNQKELSQRWGMSHRTLENWRSHNKVLNYSKIGGQVLYKFSDILEYEKNSIVETNK
jgi:DNA-binding Xre family transcriptional regulator